MKTLQKMSMPVNLVKGALLTSLIVIFSCGFSYGQNYLLKRDSVALVDFYRSTNGDSTWTSSNNWLTGALNTWEGVTVTDGRVSALQLPGNKLSGKIKNSFTALKGLKTLNLSLNAITGSIPDNLGNLSNLETVNLSFNSFTGDIPFSIGRLSKLQYLALNNNQIGDRLPWQIGFLSELTYLDLSNNAIVGRIPYSIGGLAKLFRLVLSNNKLEGTIPTSIGNLTEATRIFLNDNALCGEVPSTIGKLINLSYLSLANNQLTGSLPAGINSLTLINTINVTGNKLSGLPLLTGMPATAIIQVANNNLTFDDIIPNISRLARGSYAPQDSVAENESIIILVGDTLKLSAAYGDTTKNIKYQWFKKNSAFRSAVLTVPTLEIPNADSAKSGVYYARITNSAAPRLGLFRKVVFVTVTNDSSLVNPPSTLCTKAYPIPVENELTVEVTTPQTQDLVLSIVDKWGHMVYTSKKSTNEKVTINGCVFQNTDIYYLISSFGDKNEVIKVFKK